MSYYPSIIARANTTGFAGRYVHSAGPPEHVIPLLQHLYDSEFHRNLDAMQSFLVNEHPGGWSRLGTDTTVDTGWNNDRRIKRDGFVCFCHGDRHEAAAPYTQDSDPTFMDWLYIMRPEGVDLSVLAWGDPGEYGEAAAAWKYIGRAGWDENGAMHRPDILAALHAHAEQIEHDNLMDQESPGGALYLDA